MQNPLDLKLKSFSCAQNSVQQSLSISLNCDLKSTTIADVKRDYDTLMGCQFVRNLSFSTLEICAATCQIIDSQGLNFLVMVVKQMKLRNVTIRLVVAKRSVYRTLLSVRMEHQLDLVFQDPATV